MAERMVSHYHVVRKLGAGGMGEVLLARDTRLDRVVALKIMSADLAKEAKKHKRFSAEAKAASGLSHPRTEFANLVSLPKYQALLKKLGS